MSARGTVGGTLLSVSGGIEGTTLSATGAITSAGSLSLDGTTDTITAASGMVSFADENLTTTGATTTAGLTIFGLDCTGNANGGALTTSAGGVVTCSDDEVGTIAADSLDFDDLADALTADATTTIDLDTNGADLDVDANTFFVDSSENRVGTGTSTPSMTLDVDGDVRATGTITADGGIDLGMGSLDQSPGDPVLAGSLLGLGNFPASVFVSGRYAYVVDGGFKVIDVSDPSAPALTGSLAIGGSPTSVFVSGRYAYVASQSSDDLKVIDVSDPSAPALAGSLGIGSSPQSVFVSGRYAYVVDPGSQDLKVIDVSDPIAPMPAGSLVIGGTPRSVFVSGRYAYVVDTELDDLKVIDLTGAEFSSGIVHSLEAGSLQVRESLTVQGQLQVTGGATIGAGGLFSDGNVGIDGTLALATDVVPTSSPGNAILLYAAGDPAELQVRDESGNVTVLSPHNFSLAGAPSEPLAWSYYSVHRDHGRINVDLLRTVRLVEELSGERLVHALAADGSEIPPPAEPEASLRAELDALRGESEALEQEHRGLVLELAWIQEALGTASASSSVVAP